MLDGRRNALQRWCSSLLGWLSQLIRRCHSPFDRIVCICDYSDMARLEIELGLRNVLPQWVQIHFLPVSNFNTTEAGFALAQLALTQGNCRTLFFVNVAPRKDSSHRRVDNSGEPFVIAKLFNGSVILSTLGGHCLSWIRGEVCEIHRVKNGPKKSQFRSRDWLVPAVKLLVTRDHSFIGDRLQLTEIPNPPADIVAAYIDNYGNIKTNLRAADIQTPPGSMVDRSKVTIRSPSEGEDHPSVLTASAGAGIFDVLPGEAVIAPGSTTFGRNENPFIEISVRSGSAAEVLGDKSPLTAGTPLQIVFEATPATPAAAVTAPVN